MDAAARMCAQRTFNCTDRAASLRAGVGFRQAFDMYENLDPVVPATVKGSVGRQLRKEYLAESEDVGPVWARQRVAGHAHRLAMHEIAPSNFELNRHRFSVFVWNAGNLHRMGRLPLTQRSSRNLISEYIFSVHSQVSRFCTPDEAEE